MKIPVLIPLPALAAGILAAYFGAGFLWAAVPLVIALALYLFLLAKSKSPVETFRASRYHAIWIALLFFGIGIIDGDFARPFEMPDDSFDGYAAAKGRIVDVTSRTAGDRAEIEVQSLIGKDGNETPCANFKTFLYSDALTKGVDDIVFFPATFSKIADNPNSFHTGYAEAMHRRGFNYSVKVTDEDVHFMEHSSTLGGIASQCREGLASFIEKTELAKPTQNFLVSILLGDRDYLNPDLRQKFAGAGVAHVLALSGMHLAIIAGIILFILFPMNFLGLYRYRLLLAVILLWGYTIISGMAPSTVRACVMMSIMALALWTERANNAFGALCLSAFLILLLNPWSIFDIGFQLSVACVAALTLFASPLNKVDHRAHPRLYKINGLLIASLVVTFTTWVIASYYFEIFPALFLPANLLMLPLLPIYLFMAAAYFFLSFLGIDIPFFTRIIDAGYSGLLGLADFFGDGSSAVHIGVTGITVLLWLAACVILAWIMRTSGNRFKYMAAASVFIAAIASAIFLRPYNPEGFLITRNFMHTEIVYADASGEYTVKPKKNAVTGFMMHGRRITVLDCPFNADIPACAPCDILLVTSSWLGRSEQITGLVEKFRPGIVVIHTSINKNIESGIVESLDSLGIAHHSLRRDGIYLQRIR